MTTPYALKALLDLAQNRSDAAAARLGKLNAQEQSAEQKLQLLLEYQQDYQARFQELARNGLDQTEWLNFRAFMSKLDNAISEQRKAVTYSQDKVEVGRIDWHAQQHKLKSFDTLSQRHQLAELRRTIKREQREQDEQIIKSLAHNRVSAEHK